MRIKTKPSNKQPLRKKYVDLPIDTNNFIHIRLLFFSLHFTNFKKKSENIFIAIKIQCAINQIIKLERL